MKLYNGFPSPLGSDLPSLPGISGLHTTWPWSSSLPLPLRVLSSTGSESAMLALFIYVHVSSAPLLGVLNIMFLPLDLAAFERLSLTLHI